MKKNMKEKFVCEQCQAEIDTRVHEPIGMKYPMWFEIGKIIIIPVLTSLFIYFGAFTRLEETVKTMAGTVLKHDIAISENQKQIVMLNSAVEADRSDLGEIKNMLNIFADRQLQVLIKLGVSPLPRQSPVINGNSKKVIK